MYWIIALILSVGIALVIILLVRITQSVNQQLAAVSQQVNERLKDTAAALQDANKTVGMRLDSASLMFADVQKSLGRLEETHRHIYEISKDISSLQELLRAPKMRGEVGETLLGKLLEEVLPKENVKLQYRFKNQDTVDAVICIGHNLIPIDAKFPLENFKRYLEAPDEEQKKPYYRVFCRDVRNRIDEIASKYILPDEGTFDFALMYIPAEAVYYQISRDEELSSFAHSRRVVFVSPNTFYAYLQAILYGLKGVNIQRNIQKILADIGRLHIDLKKFTDDFDVIGSHLSNALKKYTEARNKLEGFSGRLTAAAEQKQIEGKEAG